MLSRRSPFNSNGAIRARFSDLLKFLERPDIYFTFEVSESANQKKLREGVNSNRISVAFTKLKERIAVFVVKSSDGRLISRNHNELLTRSDPLDIVDHVLENRHELTFTSAENLHILQTVFTIVTLSGSV